MPSNFTQLDLSRVPTPSFVVDLASLEENLQKLAYVQKQSGAKVLLALKSFSMFSVAPLIAKYLSGVCTSGLHEAKLAKEFYANSNHPHMEIHTFSAAYPPEDLDEVLALSDHVIFNSMAQWQKAKPKIQAINKSHLQVGLRINPQQSEGTVALYDPSAPGSRLGITRKHFENVSLDGISGLHFHNLCEQGLEPLKRTIAAFEAQFANFLPQMQWVNFGGGHHITKADYDIEGLIEAIKAFKEKWQLEVILEPGEAIALNTGVYVTRVLDIVENEMNIAIIDGSCTAHLPDVLEMPYRPELYNGYAMDQQKYGYRIAGLSCLAGDVIGDYSFEQALNVHDKLMFMDMAHYTMVKTTTFNGVALPKIMLWDARNDQLELVREFGYEDFKMRLS